MGQEEVLRLLSKKKEPLTSNEISQLLDIGIRSVRKSLNSLKKDTTIKLHSKKLDKKEVLKRYGRIINSPNIMVYFVR